MPTLRNLTDVWNNVSTRFAALKVDVTDAASAADSDLIRMQVGGVDKFVVNKDGLIVDGGFGPTENSASVKDFGAVGDGVTDDTAAIQAAIDYCAPYTWQGSIAATKLADEFVCPLYMPKGKYRITSPIRLNRNLVWFGATKPTFFGDVNNSTILADFDDMEAFALDTAPFIADGTRPLGQFLSGTQFDAGYMTNVNGIVMHNIGVDVASGRTILGNLNLCAVTQPAIYDCGFKGAQVGIRASASWSGRVENNHIYAKAIGIYMNKDVTTMSVKNNYLTGTNTPDGSYVWPAGTGSDNSFASVISGKYYGVLAKYSGAIIDDNTIEGFDNGIGLEQCYGSNPANNYMEAINDTLYVLSSTSANVTVGTTFSASAQLLDVDGSSGESIYFDMTGIDTVSLLSTVTVSSNVDMVYVKSRKGGFLPTYNARVTMIDPETEAGRTHKIYVSSSGADTNHGMYSGAAVLTLQGAFARTRDGVKNEIIITAGESIVCSAAINTYARDIVIRSSTTTKATLTFNASGGATYALKLLEGGTVNLRDMNVVLASASNADYRACIRAKGCLQINAYACAITGSGSTSSLTGGEWTEALRVDMAFLDSTLETMQLVEAAGSGGDVMWTEVNAGTTWTTVTTDTSLKIASKQFP